MRQSLLRLRLLDRLGRLAHCLELVVLEGARRDQERLFDADFDLLVRPLRLAVAGLDLRRQRDLSNAALRVERSADCRLRRERHACGSLRRQ